MIYEIIVNESTGDMTYDLSFKVIYDFQCHTYTNHDISPLLDITIIQEIMVKESVHDFSIDQ